MSIAVNCTATAQAAGARPVRDMVFAAFPEADTVRHIVRDIGADARRKIETLLPFKIHFQELGEHKLHVAFRGQKPVGLMYVRSEQTEWGIADIGWALSLDCRVLGFTFANSRSRDTRDLPDSQFAKTLVGRDFDELIALHSHPAPTGEGEGRTNPQLDDMSRTVLRSAMKATLVTELVWHDQVSKLADLAMLYTELPGAKPGRRYVPKLEPRLHPPRRLITLHVIEARGQAGYSLGQVVRTRARIALIRDGKAKAPEDQEVELRWVLDTRGKILRVSPSASWPDDDLRLACGALRGKPIVNPGLPDNPLTSIAREISDELTAIRRRRNGR